MTQPRKPVVGGNWKMNTDRAAGVALARSVCEAVRSIPAEVILFPPFPYLLPVGETIRSAAGAAPNVALGAQDLYPEPVGAFTGEVSAPMLRDCGCAAALVGHSERRHVVGEGDDLINRKARAAIGAGLTCVLCVGETLTERERGDTDRVNERQLRSGLSGVTAEQMARVVIAYEPVWAIGTGRNATPADAQAAHARIRQVLALLFDDAAANAVRIQYGGSVSAANAAELLAMPDVDGALVGGASLKPAEFARIVEAAAKRA